jgi:hypothetical protein
MTFHLKPPNAFSGSVSKTFLFQGTHNSKNWFSFGSENGKGSLNDCP